MDLGIETSLNYITFKLIRIQDEQNYKNDQTLSQKRAGALSMEARERERDRGFHYFLSHHFSLVRSQFKRYLPDYTKIRFQTLRKGKLVRKSIEELDQ